jgi:hypothetical protein
MKGIDMTSKVAFRLDTIEMVITLEQWLHLIKLVCPVLYNMQLRSLAAA